MNLRVVLNELNKVEGLTHAEKGIVYSLYTEAVNLLLYVLYANFFCFLDPEEFLNCLLEHALKAEPFITLR